MPPRVWIKEEVHIPVISVTLSLRHSADQCWRKTIPTAAAVLGFGINKERGFCDLPHDMEIITI